MPKKMKILFICIIAVIVLCSLISCAIDSSDSDYEPYKYELTEQEKDNLEFYYEMEDAWNNYRDNQ